jgi:FSR family fosmidomycin resistance protein-like MFS transporter
MRPFALSLFAADGHGLPVLLPCGGAPACRGGLQIHVALEVRMTDAAVEVAAGEPHADTGRGRFAAVIVVGHAVKHLLTSGVPAVIIPEIKRDLALSDTQVGSLGSVQQVSGWAATMGAGYLGDRFTRKTSLMLTISLAVVGFSLFLLGVAQSYLMLLVAMLCMGFGPSMFHPPAVGALSRRFADRRAFAISLHGTGGSIGEVLGPLVAAGLLTFLFWRDVLRVEVVPAIIAAFFMFTLLKERAAIHDGAPPTFRNYLRSFAALLRQRPLVLLLLVSACRSVGQATTTIFLPIYLREDLAYSPALVGVYIAMSQLAGIGSQPLMGLLSDRFGHKSVIMPALVTFAILLALVPFADGKVALALVILGLGFFLFSMQSVLTSAAVDLAGHQVHATVVSLIYASGFVGSLAPTVAGVLADSYGLPSTFYMSGAVAAVAVLIMAVIRFPEGARGRA